MHILKYPYANTNSSQLFLDKYNNKINISNFMHSFLKDSLSS